MLDHSGFSVLEDNKAGGAGKECTFSAGEAGIPSDKT